MKPHHSLWEVLKPGSVDFPFFVLASGWNSFSRPVRFSSTIKQYYWQAVCLGHNCLSCVGIGIWRRPSVGPLKRTMRIWMAQEPTQPKKTNGGVAGVSLRRNAIHQLEVARVNIVKFQSDLRPYLYKVETKFTLHRC